MTDDNKIIPEARVVHPIRIHARHEYCGGELEHDNRGPSAGISGGHEFKHTCDKCQEVLYLSQPYPALDFVDILIEPTDEEEEPKDLDDPDEGSREIH